MNPVVKQLWVDALRSGKYKQARSYLANEQGHCCLGVLCELAIQNGVSVEKREEHYITDIEDDRLYYTYDDAEAVLPQSVVDWAEVPGCNPDVLSNHEEGDEDESLAGLNDAGASFEEIANIIEMYL